MTYSFIMDKSFYINLNEKYTILKNVLQYISKCDSIINVLRKLHIWSRGVAVNMPACHAGDRRFDPGRDRHFSFYESFFIKAFLFFTDFFSFISIQ